MPPFASSGSHRGESLSLLRRRESPLSSPTPAAPSASATIVPDPRTLDPFPPSLPTSFFSLSLSLSLSLCRRPFHFDRFSLNYSSHLRRRPSRATSTSTSTSSSSTTSLHGKCTSRSLARLPSQPASLPGFRPIGTLLVAAEYAIRSARHSLVPISSPITLVDSTISSVKVCFRGFSW